MTPSVAVMMLRPCCVNRHGKLSASRQCSTAYTAWRVYLRRDRCELVLKVSYAALHGLWIQTRHAEHLGGRNRW
jgi:hypothetical protein